MTSEIIVGKTKNGENFIVLPGFLWVDGGRQAKAAAIKQLSNYLLEKK